MDSKSKAFWCTTEDGKGVLVPFEASDPLLECVSPYDLENTLKACKKGIVDIPVHCQVKGSTVTCKNMLGELSLKPVSSVDHYFCLTVQHWKRVYDRCF